MDDNGWERQPRHPSLNVNRVYKHPPSLPTFPSYSNFLLTEIEEQMAKPAAPEHNYPMSSGDHPHSYARNSQYQGGVADAAKTMIAAAISEKLEEFTDSPFRIADLGCSIGPNTFSAVQNLIDAVRPRCLSPTDFHVFFCDHAGNDFNVLFRTLPPTRPYFAAGVPGSFHRRLFPPGTLHLAHASYALHWLSQVPEAVADRKSAAFNGTHIHCIGTGREEVTEAYLEQFYGDMEKFLYARAEEMVSGGLMVIVSACLPDEPPPLHLQAESALIWETLGDCIKEMAKEGLIDEEKAETFNLPMYFPTPGQLRWIVEKNGMFSVEKVETFPHPAALSPTICSDDVTKFAAMLRATVEALLGDHFGSGGIDVDDAFRRYTRKLQNEGFPGFCDQIRKRIEVFVLLKRN